jgi:hypothetical protein
MSLSLTTFFRSYAQTSYDCEICAEQHEAHTPIAAHIAHHRVSDGSDVIHQFCLKFFRAMCRYNMQNNQMLTCPLCRKSPGLERGILVENKIIMNPKLLEREVARIKNHEIYLADLNPELRNEYDIAMAGVIENGFDLSQLSSECQNNKNIVLAAINSKPERGRAIASASDTLKDDEDIALTAVHNDPSALEFVSDRLKNLRKIVEVAVSKNGETLRHASAAMRNDKDIVLKAVTQSVSAYKYASFLMRTDSDVYDSFKRHRWTALPAAGEQIDFERDLFKEKFAVTIKEKW